MLQKKNLKKNHQKISKRIAQNTSFSTTLANSRRKTQGILWKISQHIIKTVGITGKYLMS